MSTPSFKSGEPIRDSGLYQVLHEAHALPSEVTLFKGYTFPPCAECAAVVHFALVRPMPHLDKLREKMVLHGLPVLDRKVA